MRGDCDLIFDLDECRLFLSDLPEVDERLVEIFRAIGLIFLARKLQGCRCQKLQPMIINATVNIMGDSNDCEWVDLCSNVQNDSPEAYFRKATYLLRHQKLTSRSKGLILALAKTCLVKVLEATQPSSLFFDAASMYLATLLYMEKQYQLTLDLCVSVASK